MDLVVCVGRKGVIVLPKAVRKALHLVEDSLLEVETGDGEIVLRPWISRSVSGAAAGARQRQPRRGSMEKRRGGGRSCRHLRAPSSGLWGLGEKR